MFKQQNILNSKSFFLIFILTIFSSNIFASYNKYEGTVFLRDGTKYEDVTFKIISRFKSISFDYFDKEIHVSFSDIDRIYDKDNNEITEQILGGYYKPTEDRKENIEVKPVEEETYTENKNWISRESSRYKKSQEKFWSTGILLRTSYSMPSGNYYEGLTSGNGYEGDYLIAINHKYSLRFSYGKAGIKTEDGYELIYSFNPAEVEILEQKITFDTYIYSISFQYNEQMESAIPDKSMLYTFTGLGIANEKAKMDLVIRDNINNFIFSDQISDSETQLTFSLGIGVVKMVSPTLGFNAEIGLDVVGGFDEKVEAYIFDISLGLAFIL